MGVGVRSPASRRRKRPIASAESSIASSMFTSMSCAPASTCWRATSTASSKRSSRISFANLREPVTFVRLPTVHEDVAGLGIASDSRPDRRVFGSISWQLSAANPRDGVGDRPDVGRRRPAAAAGDVEQPVAGEAAQDVGHRLRRVVVTAELVGQSGVRVARDGERGDPREVRDVRRRAAAPSAVQPDDDRPGVGDRGPERLDGLAAERPTGGVEIVPETISGRLVPSLLRRLDAEDRRLAVERVEDRLDQEDAPPSIRPSAASW